MHKPSVSKRVSELKRWKTNNSAMRKRKKNKRKEKKNSSFNSVPEYFLWAYEYQMAKEVKLHLIPFTYRSTQWHIASFDVQCTLYIPSFVLPTFHRVIHKIPSSFVCRLRVNNKQEHRDGQSIQSHSKRWTWRVNGISLFLWNQRRSAAVIKTKPFHNSHTYNR